MLTILVVNILVIGLAVLIHYEILYRLSLVLPKLKIKNRFKIVVGVFGGLFAHSVEVWLFGLTYYLLNHVKQWGTLTGEYDGSLLDNLYFSYTTYTTLGFGDIQPHGYLRHLVGLESLTGLLLITWTASFLYFEMQRYWNDKA